MCVVEVGNPGDYGLLLGGRKVRKDRERERLFRGALALREIALSVAERAEAVLKVEGHRVVDFGSDRALAQVLAERVTPPFGDADDVLVVHVPAAGRGLGKTEA